MKEIIAQNWWFFVTGLLLAISGVYIVQAKAYHLISGYNTMPPEKKKKVNIEMVAIAVRNAFFLLCILLIIIPILTELLDINQVKILLLIVSHFVVIISLVIILYKGKKYKISR
jgi:hypothetical protein